MEQIEIPIQYDARFVLDYAKPLVANPGTALVELVANAWDAGASNVWIHWPENPDKDEFSIEDNGTGMTANEFRERWTTLNYNRLAQQGQKAEFPPGSVQKAPRYVYGCNGKGRHSMFFFNDFYEIETWKNGECNHFLVRQSRGAQPWVITHKGASAKPGHGTRLFAKPRCIVWSPEQVRTLLGTKFIADPDFSVSINNQTVTFEDIEDFVSKAVIEVLGYGDVEIVKVDASRGRTTKQHGVAWWVNNRLVGKPSWDGVNGALLDGRTNPAKSLTFIVKAPIFEPAEDISEDWSRFKDSERVTAVRAAVGEHIAGVLRDETRATRKDRKRRIFEENSDALRTLPILSREKVSEFVDQIQDRCVTMSERDLGYTAELLIRLERASSGYELLEKLARLDPNDLDGWNSVLDQWSVSDAKRVLDELKRRLDLIGRLQELVEKCSTDELHQLQPLFEQGLWIFGPEYEGISFHSNTTLAKIVAQTFGGAVLKHPKIRPDFVALPTASIGVYARDEFDDVTGAVTGFAKVAIVELKRGGFMISGDEKDQAMRYARELLRSGKVQRSTKIMAFVLGANVDPVVQEHSIEGNITIFPRTYQSVIRQAHARTFYLYDQLKAARRLELEDPDLEAILASEVDGGSTDFFPPGSTDGHQ